MKAHYCPQLGALLPVPQLCQSCPTAERCLTKLVVAEELPDNPDILDDKKSGTAAATKRVPGTRKKKAKGAPKKFPPSDSGDIPF